MNKNKLISLMVLAATGWLSPVIAQDVYRCGDSYSQKPCAGGKVVEVDDARSASQRQQTTEAAKRDAKTADAMEKARLKEEAKPAQAYIPAAKVESPPSAKMKKPAEFKAVSPKKPASSSKKKKKKAN